MKVWGVTEEQLSVVADRIGVKLYELREDGRALRFTLRPTGDRDEWGNYPYQRRTASWQDTERRVWAVCWHGHRDFMREVFRVNPDARIKTGWADYKGAENFEENYRDTAFINVGSQMFPQQANEVCFCDTH